MELKEVFEKLETIAPVALSNEFCAKFKMYDNSGIIIDCKEDIKGVLFSLDLSSKAIEEAKKKGFNLIITHHPAIFGGISRISADDLIGTCLKSGISVISMHLNFDAAPCGIDHHLMRGLGGEKAEILDGLQNGGYGRVYRVKEVKFSELEIAVCKNFNTQRALFYGDKNKTVKKIASFCGAGCNNEAIEFARFGGADVFVSSDMKHHEIAKLIELGINVIHLTHYSAENYGFNKIYTQISSAFSIPSAYFADKELL